MKMTDESLEEVLSRTLGTLSERASNGEPANIVDGLFAIASAIERLASVHERAVPPYGTVPTLPGWMINVPMNP